MRVVLLKDLRVCVMGQGSGRPALLGIKSVHSCVWESVSKGSIKSVACSVSR